MTLPLFRSVSLGLGVVFAENSTAEWFLPPFLWRKGDSIVPRQSDEQGSLLFFWVRACVHVRVLFVFVQEA